MATIVSVLNRVIADGRLFMPSGLHWFYFAAILGVAYAGAYYPLVQPESARGRGGFPRGESFASGVFLALALLMLLPSAIHVFGQALPGLHYPIAGAIAIGAFVSLLALEHATHDIVAAQEAPAGDERLPAIIPIVMTALIAVPSFFLGTVLGLSRSTAAVLIFVAIILHKGSAAFALSLIIVRSRLAPRPGIGLFSIFAFATPLGILAGDAAHEVLTDSALLVKGVILALGAGVFLYMGTLHELKHASMIEHCSRRSSFAALLAGLLITGLVRLLVGEAHQL